MHLSTYLNLLATLRLIEKQASVFSYQVSLNIYVHLFQLPYYIDGDIRLSESDSILRHIARKNNLCGETEQERCRVDVALGALKDILVGLVTMNFSPDYVSIKILIAYLC